MPAHHTKTIVVDFDDTLAITLNRDWVNATPNRPLIKKLNWLFYNGWDIHIVTARGQLSCKGDSVAADNKYRKQIEQWLINNDVRYTSLSFQKKLAAYYIDDKGIHPDLFLKDFDERPLTGGKSGASVTFNRATQSVSKTASNTRSVIEWFEKAETYAFGVPVINTVIGDTINMEILNPTHLDFYGDQLAAVLKDLKRFSKIPPIHVIEPESYVDRCIRRICETPHANFGDDLGRIIEFAERNTIPSFSHGDFSVSNIMQKDGNIIYIDPINDHTLLSSWIVDAAKLYMTINPECRPVIENFVVEMKSSVAVLEAHEIGHMCRVYPYLTDKLVGMDMVYEKTEMLKSIKSKIECFLTKNQSLLS